MAENQKPEPKISLPEFIFVGLFIVLVDTIDLIGLLFAFPMSDITDVVMFPVTQIYLYMKGVRGTFMLIGNLIEAIPWIGDLPVRTVVWCITYFIDHHPKLEKITEVVGGATGGKAGGEAVAVDGAGGANAATGEIENIEKSGAIKTAEGGNKVGNYVESGTEEMVRSKIETETTTGKEANEGGASENGIEPEKLGEEREPVEKLEKELLEEPVQDSEEKGGEEEIEDEQEEYKDEESENIGKKELKIKQTKEMFEKLGELRDIGEETDSDKEDEGRIAA